MDLVSVIIPIYNTAAYLDECIASVLMQTYPALELILVDDGSTDASPGICDRYARSDARIRCIHQENGGLSHARNAGTACASGEWILFLDSDDCYRQPDLIERLVSAADASCDIVCFNYRRLYAD